MKNVLLIGIMALMSSISYSQVKVVTPKVKVTKPKVLKKKKKKKATNVNKATESNRKRPGGTIKTKKLDGEYFFDPRKPEDN